jgi:hypothetical protein
MAEIVWTLGATQDFQDAFNRFEEHRPGAGVRFAEEVESKLVMLTAFPPWAQFTRTIFAAFSFSGASMASFTLSNRVESSFMRSSLADKILNPSGAVCRADKTMILT